MGVAETKVARILAELRGGPKTNRELCELVDEIPSYLSRTMAKLRQRGLVVNAGMPGRGHAALYQLAGRS